MEVQELANILSSFQFKQSLDWTTYLAVAACAGLGGWFASYVKEKGKNYANKEDFDSLKKQLKENTTLIEGIKTKLSEKSWVNQQIWLKKIEAYEVIFELIFHVKKYVTHQLDEFEAWEYIYHGHPYMNYYQYDKDDLLLERWEKEKSEYEEKVKSPATKQEAEKLKTKYEESIVGLFEVIEVKAIYLDAQVGKAIKQLKSELSTTHEHEEWDAHFYRINNATMSTIEKVRQISKGELRIET